MKKSNVTALCFLFLFVFLTLLACRKDVETSSADHIRYQKSDMLTQNEFKSSVPSYFGSLFISPAEFARTSITNSAIDVLPEPLALEWEHIKVGAANTSYKPKGWKHIDVGPDKTYYEEPTDLEHMKTGPNKTQMGPKGFEHVTDGPEKTTYAPKGTKHITEGPDKSKYDMGGNGYVHIDTGVNKTYFRKKAALIFVEEL